MTDHTLDSADWGKIEIALRYERDHHRANGAAMLADHIDKTLAKVVARTGDAEDSAAARVRALVNNQRPAMVAAWIVGQRDGEERLTSVSVIRYRDVVDALGED